MTRKLLAICLDCGDTLIDEGTEEKTEAGVSLRAELIPGADKLLHELKKMNYPLALVADGPTDTFTNNLGPYGLYELFDAYAISEEVGVSKPDRRIFDYALEQLNIDERHYGKVVMVGNSLARDIKGANQLGMITVWLDWAPRRSKTPADESEKPDYTIKAPLELLDILNELESNDQ